MNRERAKELLPIIQAFAEGKEVQLKIAKDNWKSLESFDFQCQPHEYRIKPEPREFWIFPDGTWDMKSVSSNPITETILASEVLDDE